MQIDLIASRNAIDVAFIRQTTGICVSVISRPTASDVRGRRVAGCLSLWLASQTAAYAVIEFDSCHDTDDCLNTLEDYRRAGAALRWYDVRTAHNGCPWAAPKTKLPHVLSCLKQVAASD